MQALGRGGGRGARLPPPWERDAVPPRSICCAWERAEGRLQLFERLFVDEEFALIAWRVHNAGTTPSLGLAGVSLGQTEKGSAPSTSGSLLRSPSSKSRTADSVALIEERHSSLSLHTRSPNRSLGAWGGVWSYINVGAQL